MEQISEILLRRKHKVNISIPKFVDAEKALSKNKSMVLTVMKNVEAYGFTLDKELIRTLLLYSDKDIKDFYFDLISKLKPLVGADKEHHPMYPNFPQQVADALESELFFNAIIHYWSFGILMPEYTKNERFPLIDDNKMTVLSIGTDDDILEIFKNLASSKTSISEQDKEDIRYIIRNYPNFYSVLPDEIPLKENVAFITKTILDEAPLISVNYIQKYYKTATDVLRFIVALSDGDISLATKTKYRKLRRRERRMIMDLLAGCGNITEDLYRYHYDWIHIGEIIHPFEFKDVKYESVRQAFNTLRNEHKPLFLTGQIQEAIKSNDMLTAAKLLTNRPGEFARQLDKLIRDSKNKDEIIKYFSSVVNNVSTPVLLQLRQYYKGRNSDRKVRVFFPKGRLAKAISIPNKLPTINEDICKKIVKICDNALFLKYKEKDDMGKVFVDEELRNYLVPFSQRSASSANKTVVRGSRLPIKADAKAVRGFIWWTNEEYSRVDIDLSATIYDENWNYIERVSYTNLRSAKYKAYHSGDITNGGSLEGNGVSEFIDVDFDSVFKNVGRYIVFQVYNYTNQKFSDLPNCRFGWMEREDVDSGEIFEPKTVNMNIDVRAESTVAIPVIFDCYTREFIWCDMNLAATQTSSYRGGNNLESNLKGVTAVCYAMANMNKPNIYSLICFNAMARGQIVTDRNEADIIFSNDTTKPIETISEYDEETKTYELVDKEKTNVPIITAFDFDYFVGELL